jgi:hypothetical protein
MYSSISRPNFPEYHNGTFGLHIFVYLLPVKLQRHALAS